MASVPPRTELQTAVARNSAESFARLQNGLMPEVWELNRWMLASLLAVNSAAAAAVYGAQNVSADMRLAACRFFIFGALCAMASGFSQMHVLARLNSTVTDAQHYWSTVAGGAERSAEWEQRHADGARTKIGFIPTLLLYASATLFVCGVFQLKI